MTAEWWLRGPVCLAVLLLAGCAGTDEGYARRPHDYLTDLTDDGTLVMAAFRPDPAERRVALRGLARLPAPEGYDLLYRLATDEADPGVLEELCFTLGAWTRPDSIPYLEDLAAHDASRVSAAAVEALGRYEGLAPLPLLTGSLTSPHRDVRRAAALALFRCDARRSDHERDFAVADLDTRDAALAQAALDDEDSGVRWRAAYALGQVRGRPGLTTVLRRCLRDLDTPLSRVFALRGLVALTEEGLANVGPMAPALLDDPDPRVASEAAQALTAHGSLAAAVAALGSVDGAQLRAVLARGLGTRLHEADDEDDLPQALREEARAVLAILAQSDPSPVVRREALASEVLLGEPSAAAEAMTALAGSTDPRDRIRAAELLATGQVMAAGWLEQLQDDPVPSVRAAALDALLGPQVVDADPLLVESLSDEDPAVRASAAEAAQQAVQEGRASPALVAAVARALEQTRGYEMTEARAAMAEALGLPALDTDDLPARPEGELADRLVEQYRRSLQDPSPVILLETTRGEIRLVLDRVNAPLHVASFLELADAGFYDGLSIHRVVPNFVVQGLDPRGDGWGTGGRRLPDEFNRTPFLSGTLGMPHAGLPHSGGCQIFITHLPTPHLDGAYTAFGRVEQGMHVVEQLAVGDLITGVRRVAPP